MPKDFVVPHFTDLEMGTVTRMHMQGKSYQEVFEMTGLDFDEIKVILKKYTIFFRKPGGPPGRKRKQP